jgi:hypothetical protein
MMTQICSAVFRVEWEKLETPNPDRQTPYHRLLFSPFTYFTLSLFFIVQKRVMPKLQAAIQPIRANMVDATSLEEDDQVSALLRAYSSWAKPQAQQDQTARNAQALLKLIANFKTLRQKDKLSKRQEFYFLDWLLIKHTNKPHITVSHLRGAFGDSDLSEYNRYFTQQRMGWDDPLYNCRFCQKLPMTLLGTVLGNLSSESPDVILELVADGVDLSMFASSETTEEDRKWTLLLDYLRWTKEGQIESRVKALFSMLWAIQTIKQAIEVEDIKEDDLLDLPTPNYHFVPIEESLIAEKQEITSTVFYWYIQQLSLRIACHKNSPSSLFDMKLLLPFIDHIDYWREDGLLMDTANVNKGNYKQKLLASLCRMSEKEINEIPHSDELKLYILDAKKEEKADVEDMIDTLEKMKLDTDNNNPSDYPKDGLFANKPSSESPSNSNAPSSIFGSSPHR